MYNLNKNMFKNSAQNEFWDKSNSIKNQDFYLLDLH